MLQDRKSGVLGPVGIRAQNTTLWDPKSGVLGPVGIGAQNITL